MNKTLKIVLIIVIVLSIFSIITVLSYYLYSSYRLSSNNKNLIEITGIVTCIDASGYSSPIVDGRDCLPMLEAYPDGKIYKFTNPDQFDIYKYLNIYIKVSGKLIKRKNSIYDNLEIKNVQLE